MVTECRLPEQSSIQAIIQSFSINSNRRHQRLKDSDQTKTKIQWCVFFTHTHPPSLACHWSLQTQRQNLTKLLCWLRPAPHLTPSLQYRHPTRLTLSITKSHGSLHVVTQQRSTASERTILCKQSSQVFFWALVVQVTDKETSRLEQKNSRSIRGSLGADP